MEAADLINVWQILPSYGDNHSIRHVDALAGWQKVFCAYADTLIRGTFERKMSPLHSTAQVKVRCWQT